MSKKHQHDTNQHVASHNSAHDSTHELHENGHNDVAEKNACEPSCCGCGSMQSISPSAVHSANAVDMEDTPSALGSQPTADGLWRTSMRITQMDCPTEEAMIRKQLAHEPNVQSMEFNLLQRVLTVVHQPDAVPRIVTLLNEIGFNPEMASASGEFSAAAPKKKSVWPLAIAGAFAVFAEMAEWFSWSDWLAIVFSVLAIALSGLGTYRKGWLAIRHGSLNINALMSIAVTGAVLIGQWPEAAMVMVLFTLAEWIEDKSLDRARNAISDLMNLTPAQVGVVSADGSVQSTLAEQVPVGSVVRAKPGERIGLDGVVVNGQSSINQAPITGESLPIEKTLGDEVFAGTINQEATIDYRVTVAAKDTTLARIIHAIEQAQGEKAPTQRFVDQFARVYTPTVFVIALLVAIVPPLLMQGAWFDWVYKALVLLVIACPCALVISTPVTVVSGLAAAARRGILIKGGVYLEEGHRLKTLAFDKTGTITVGKPSLTDFIDLSGDPQQSRLLGQSLAAQSDHPVSKALIEGEQYANTHWLTVNEFTALAGRGTRGYIDGVTYWLGNHRLIHELNFCSEALEQRIEELEIEGKTVVLLAKDQQVLALFAVADTIKSTSVQAIAELKKIGVKTVMLSGDNNATAQTVARQVGIDEAFGNLLPEDKLRTIALMSEQGKTGMVGDGINDALALARADIGFAMGAMGTDTAIETADIALMDDDLRKIPAFIRLSSSTRRILIQNISLALGVKFIFLIITLANYGTMWMAVFADVGVSLLVVANGLRLLRRKHG